jgi:hypothetical protein
MIRPATTAFAIITYLDDFSPGRALSLKRAVRQIRMIDPDCELTPQELAELVASRAVAMGFCAILFDLDAPELDEDRIIEETELISGHIQTDEEMPRAIAYIPELRRAALELAQEREHADELVERTLQVAIATFASGPDDQPLDEWLLELLLQVSNSPRRAH